MCQNQKCTSSQSGDITIEKGTGKCNNIYYRLLTIWCWSTSHTWVSPSQCLNQEVNPRQRNSKELLSSFEHKFCLKDNPNCVSKRLRHIAVKNLFVQFQSAYTPHQSTESASLKVQRDIINILRKTVMSSVRCWTWVQHLTLLIIKRAPYARTHVWCNWNRKKLVPSIPHRMVPENRNKQGNGLLNTLSLRFQRSLGLGARPTLLILSSSVLRNIVKPCWLNYNLYAYDTQVIYSYVSIIITWEHQKRRRRLEENKALDYRKHVETTRW